MDKTLNFITKEMNITSISPLFIFDVAKIGPASPSFGGTRYAVGGGIRFTLSAPSVSISDTPSIQHAAGMKVQARSSSR